MILSKKKQGLIKLIDKNVDLNVIDSSKAQILKELIVKADTDEEAKNIVSLVELKSHKITNQSQTHIKTDRRSLQDEEKKDNVKRIIFATVLTAIVLFILYKTIGLLGIAIIGLIASGLLKFK